MSIDIKASTMIKMVVVILGFVLVYLLREVIIILFLAIMIASAIGPFANWLESKRIPRLPGVIALYVLFFGLTGFFLSLVIPIITVEINQLTQTLPRLFSGFSTALEGAQGSSSLSFVTVLQSFLNSLAQFLQVSSGSLLSVVINIFGGVVSFLAVIIISFYFSVMKQGIPSFFRSVLPQAYEEYVIDLWKRAEAQVGRWFQGQLLLAVSVGIVVFVGLSLFHVKYALLLGITAMMLEIVPVVGPIVSAIPGIAFAYLQSPTLALGVFVFYLVVQQIESHVLAPIILGRTLGLNPVTVVISLLIGGKLAGILGVLLAVPVAVVIVEIMEDMAEKRSRTVVPQLDI